MKAACSGTYVKTRRLVQRNSSIDASDLRIPPSGLVGDFYFRWLGGQGSAGWGSEDRGEGSRGYGIYDLYQHELPRDPRKARLVLHGTPPPPALNPGV